MEGGRGEMRKEKRPAPRFIAGQKVQAPMVERGTVFIVSGSPTWNGLTWMYDFHGKSVRMGEHWLVPVIENEAGEVA